MSFANRFKSKLSGGGEVHVAPAPAAAAEPAATPEPFMPRTAVAQNENGFIPTKFGEDIPDAKRTYLPRAAAGTQVQSQAQVNVDDMLMFPSLGATIAAPAAVAPPKKTGWADKAKEWAADDAQKKADAAAAADDEYSW